jgi:hypothetical protein
MTLGANEQAARDLGITSVQALMLQRVAAETLPVSGTLPLVAGGALLAVALVRRRV